MRLVKFATNNGIYDFPDAQTTLGDNFTDLVPATERVQGMDGGFDRLFERPAPQSIGNISVEWWLLPSSIESITDLKDAVRKMASWGKGKLFVRPENAEDDNRDVRWCEARINNVQISENVRNMPHLRQRVSADFQVSNPVWYGYEEGPDEPAHNADKWWYLDDGFVLDTAGLTLGGPRVQEDVLTGDTVDITNSGSHVVYPVLRFQALTLATTCGFGLRRLFGASETVVEEWFWDGRLVVGETVVIDCAKKTVMWESATGDLVAIDDFTIRKGFGFMELSPGTHTFEIFTDYPDDYLELRFTVDFFDAWY